MPPLRDRPSLQTRLPAALYGVTEHERPKGHSSLQLREQRGSFSGQTGLFVFRLVGRAAAVDQHLNDQVFENHGTPQSALEHQIVCRNTWARHFHRASKLSTKWKMWNLHERWYHCFTTSMSLNAKRILPFTDKLMLHKNKHYHSGSAPACLTSSTPGATRCNPGPRRNFVPGNSAFSMLDTLCQVRSDGDAQSALFVRNTASWLFSKKCAFRTCAVRGGKLFDVLC